MKVRACTKELLEKYARQHKTTYYTEVAKIVAHKTKVTEYKFPQDIPHVSELLASLSRESYAKSAKGNKHIMISAIVWRHGVVEVGDGFWPLAVELKKAPEAVLDGTMDASELYELRETELLRLRDEVFNYYTPKGPNNRPFMKYES
jgi:hypothetical protein